MSWGRHKGDKAKRKKSTAVALDHRKGKGRSFMQACDDFWAKRGVVNHGFRDDMAAIARGNDYA